MLIKTLNLRLATVCVVAVSMGLSIALISIAKLLLFVCAIFTLMRVKHLVERDDSCGRQATPVAVLVCLVAFTLSLIWTVAPVADALGSIAKYGKLLVIVIFMLLIRNRKEALCALGWFVGGQLFLVLSSWALYIGLPVPWATSNMALKEYAVFSSYLDQGIMGSVLAAVCWHLRHLAPGRFGRQMAIAIAVVAMSNVLFVLSGRSGHVVAIALLSLAIMWQLPKRYRAVVVLIPFLLAAALFVSSTKVRDRLTMVGNEVKSYSSHEQSNTSSGIRLGLWRSAAQMIAENPVADSGETRMCLAKEFQTGIAHAIRRLPLWHVRIDEPGEGRVKIVKQLCIRAQANRASRVFRQDDSIPPKQIFADDLSVDERPNFVNCFRLACRGQP